MKKCDFMQTLKKWAILEKHDWTKWCDMQL